MSTIDVECVGEMMNDSHSFPLDNSILIYEILSQNEDSVTFKYLLDQAIPHLEVGEMLVERRSNCIVGEIGISEWIKNEFEKRMLELFESGREYIPEGGRSEGKFIWVFGDTRIEEIDNEKIIFARLGKVKKELFYLTFDKETKQFKRKKGEEPRALNYSNFILHLNSHKILFEEKLPDISIKQFVDKFFMLYIRYFNDLSTITIDIMREPLDQLYALLNQYDKITEVQLKVTPSNPNDEPEFRRIDSFLKNSNTQEGTFKFTNKEDSLLIEGTIIGEGVALSKAGHGKYRITGEIGGEKKFIKSEDRIARFYIDTYDDIDILLRSFWEKLKGLVRRR